MALATFRPARQNLGAGGRIDMFRYHTQAWLSALSVTVIVFCTVTFLSSNAYAAECTEGFCPLADVEGSRLEGLYSGPEGDLAVFFGRLFYFALSIGAILAILRIAWGGYLYMTTDLWSSKERAKEVLRETTLGLFLLLAVWLILHQINPKILELNIDIKALPNQGQVRETPTKLKLSDEVPSGKVCVSFVDTSQRRCFSSMAACQAAIANTAARDLPCEKF